MRASDIKTFHMSLKQWATQPQILSLTVRQHTAFSLWTSEIIDDLIKTTISNIWSIRCRVLLRAYFSVREEQFIFLPPVGSFTYCVGLTNQFVLNSCLFNLMYMPRGHDLSHVSFAVLQIGEYNGTYIDFFVYSFIWKYLLSCYSSYRRESWCWSFSRKQNR